MEEVQIAFSFSLHWLADSKRFSILSLSALDRVAAVPSYWMVRGMETRAAASGERPNLFHSCKYRLEVHYRATLSWLSKFDKSKGGSRLLKIGYFSLGFNQLLHS